VHAISTTPDLFPAMWDVSLKRKPDQAVGLSARWKGRHCEERSDEAIYSFFARRDGLLRFARNDGNK
jgi:hypothetical protein